MLSRLALRARPVRYISRGRAALQAQPASPAAKLPPPPAAPVAENGPVIRRPVTVDREFPDPFEAKKKNRYYFVAYGIGVTLACVIVFNYEKTRSPVINSVFYCLRRSEASKQALGANIGYTSSWPWISGELNTMQGRVNITFKVKGDKNEGTVKMRATRANKLHPFDVHEWTLTIRDGPVIDLLKDTSVNFGL